MIITSFLYLFLLTNKSDIDTYLQRLELKHIHNDPKTRHIIKQIRKMIRSPPFHRTPYDSPDRCYAAPTPPLASLLLFIA